MSLSQARVLVVVVRGLQATALGCYGSDWIDTPALDGLAAEGVVFDWHLADAASPQGARRAWRTGRYDLPTPEPVEYAASGDVIRLLGEQGIPTCLILDDSRVCPAGFAEGWSEVRQVTPGSDDTPLEATLDEAQECLEKLAEQDSFLLWVELATLLPPWETPADFVEPYFTEEEPPEEEDEELEEDDLLEEFEPLVPMNDPQPGPIDLDDDEIYLCLQTSYAAAISYLDAGLAQLLETLADLDLDEETTVIVLSDCGQALGEHGVVGPVRPWLHEEVLHLPLLIRLPDRAEAGRRVLALTQNVDLAPTLAELFGLPPLPCHGHSLLPLLHGQAEQVRDYACAGLRVNDGIEWCLRTLDWSFLLPVQPHLEDPERLPQLYVKPDDRTEMNNVIQHFLDWSERLAQALKTFVTATRQPGPLQPPALPEVQEEASRHGRRGHLSKQTGEEGMFSQTVEYALRAVVYLAGQAPDYRTTGEIAQATRVKQAYLAKVLQKLTQHQIVRSQRGLGGGVVLARAPENLTILEVVQAVDPIRRIRECPLGLAAHGIRLCPLHKRLDNALASVEKAFGETTLAEILAEPSESVPLCDFPVQRPENQPRRGATR